MLRDTSSRYSGTGKTVSSRGVEELPPVNLGRLRDPALYQATPALRDAVNVALTLSMPLLITGPPGCGKTDLAASIAYELELEEEIFVAKTTSVASDLLYTFDALLKLQDGQANERDWPLHRYLRFGPLGRAILRAMPNRTRAAGAAANVLPPALLAADQVQTVVLIDEIDKAPRDFPNDLLDEIENLRFTVVEGPEPITFSAKDTLKPPILIITSNAERELPKAFMRRCAYFDITPATRADLHRIITEKLSEPAALGAWALDVLELLRTESLENQPSTAEFLRWVKYLQAQREDIAGHQEPVAAAAMLHRSLIVLLKNPEDQERAKVILETPRFMEAMLHFETR